MPVIRVDGPKISVDKKRELAKRLTEAAAEIYGMDKEHIIVLIRENKPENVSVERGWRTDCRQTAKVCGLTETLLSLPLTALRRKLPQVERLLVLL